MFLFYEPASEVAGFPPGDIAIVALTPVLAGLTGDFLIRRGIVPMERPLTVYAFGGVVAFVLWSLDMAAIWAVEGMGWTPELWSGTILLCTLVGIGLTIVAAPPKAANARTTRVR
jgi:hypothetical protein